MEKSIQRDSSGLWKLETDLGIPIWHNYLSIPNSDLDYTSAEIRLQEQLNFVFIRDTDNSCRIFISEKTDFDALVQCLPFISDPYDCFICNDQLINERLMFLKQSKPFAADNEATRQLVDLLETAAVKGASDVHLESLANKKSLRLRINGILQRLSLDSEISDRLFSKIKLISRLDIAKKRSPQDGHFPYTSRQGKRYDMRVSTLPGIFGEKIVVRLLPASTVQFSMEELGFAADHMPLIKNRISKKSGMILLTGPTGSGKTTSLYAILKAMDSEALNIVTVEDPVEYRLDDITQVQVNPLAGVTFSNTLRSFLRQDPDVILIGEIRDQETAQIAARAAQTGHLVLSTLHSNDAFETIRRLQNLGVENDDIASSLKMVISQRLVQKRCECAGDPACRTCMGSGTNGRIPLMEVLEVTPQLSMMISQGDPISKLRTQAEKNHHKPLRSIGEQLIAEGLIFRADFESVCEF